MSGGQAPYAQDFIHGVLLARQTAEGITGIGGIGNDAAVAQDGNGLPNQPGLRVIGMNTEYLRHRAPI